MFIVSHTRQITFSIFMIIKHSVTVRLVVELLNYVYVTSNLCVIQGPAGCVVIGRTVRQSETEGRRFNDYS